MSKRKASAAAKSAGARAAPASGPAPRAGATTTGPGTGRRPRRWRWLAVAAVALLALGAGGWQWRERSGRPAGPAAGALATAAPAGPVGGALACRQLPRFAAREGFGSQAALSTSESGQMGLTLVDLADRSRSYRHPSWSGHGYLGPVTYDRDGNAYTAPTPHVSLIENPPEQQNTLFKVDTETGEMTELLRLPFPSPPSAQNPFGIMGLAYDCATHSLYVSSVGGSTRQDEVGQIARLDLATGQVADTLSGVDAMGLAVFDGPVGRRLVFGAARQPDIRSVALAANGDFAAAPRHELRIPGWSDKARRITFDGPAMKVVGVPFRFTLSVTSDLQQSQYQFAYDAATDAWQYIGE